MENSLQTIESLYKREIEVYQKQIDELKSENKTNIEKNGVLLNKVRELTDLMDKAHETNKDLHDAFEHVREENLKLKLHTDSQDKAPMRTDEREVALETMQRQFVDLAGESVCWISEKDRLTQRIKFLERECERYSRDNTTLGKQVRHLLKTLEEERGMIIRRNNQVQEYSELMTASDVIDSHLITFETIEGLQLQNQKLLSLVKELSKKEEERDTQVENEDIKRLNTDIETLKSQLEIVKSDRERIMDAFKTILKERDLFKILLCKTKQVEHLTPEVFQRMVTIACSSGPAIEGPEDTQDKEAHINDLKAMISKLENELESLKDEYQTYRKRNEDELKLKTELLEQTHHKILIESQHSEVLKQRNELLENNLKTLIDEFDEARTKLQKITFEAEQLKKENEIITNALEQEKLKKESELSLKEENLALERKILSFKEEMAENRSKSQLIALQIQHLEQDKQALANSLEQERRQRQAELSTILVEIQSKSDLRYDLQMKLNKAEEKIASLESEIRDIETRNSVKHQSEIQELQRLRDIEKLGRLELARKFYALTRYQSTQPNQCRQIKLKKRPKNDEKDRSESTQKSVSPAPAETIESTKTDIIMTSVVEEPVSQPATIKEIVPSDSVQAVSVQETAKPEEKVNTEVPPAKGGGIILKRRKNI